MFFLAANQNIRMISEGSCDWSNDAKKSALIDHNKLHSQVNLKLFCVIAKYILNKLQTKIYTFILSSHSCNSSLCHLPEWLIMKLIMRAFIFSGVNHRINNDSSRLLT